MVLADLKVGKPAAAVAVDIIGNEIDRDRELFDRLIKIPIFYIFRTVVEMERRTGANVGLGVATETVIFAVGLGMIGGVRFGVGLGSATGNVWLPPVESPAPISATTMITMTVITTTAPPPANQTGLGNPPVRQTPGPGPEVGGRWGDWPFPCSIAPSAVAPALSESSLS